MQLGFKLYINFIKKINWILLVQLQLNVNLLLSKAT